MGNKNTHDKLLNPTLRTTKLDTRKKVAILIFYKKGRKKTKEIDRPHKDKKYKRTNHKEKLQ